MYGILIGDNIINNERILTYIDAKFIDMACTAYSSRSEEKKAALYEKITPMLGKMNYAQCLDIELKLTSTIKREYQNHYISNRMFNENTFLDGEYRFLNCTFRNCTFHECAIVTSAFRECVFYNCKFYNVIILRDTDQNCRLIFSDNCVGYEQFAKEASYEEKIVEEDNYEKAILKRYWNLGGRYSKGKLPEAYILRNMNPEDRQGYEQALETLKKKEMIYREGHYWYLNKNNIKEIKDMLGISNDK